MSGKPAVIKDSVWKPFHDSKDINNVFRKFYINVYTSNQHNEDNPNKIKLVC